MFKSQLMLVNPGLKVNQSINFSCLKMFFIAYSSSFCKVWDYSNSKLKDKQCLLTENVTNLVKSYKNDTS